MTSKPSLPESTFKPDIPIGEPVQLQIEDVKYSSFFRGFVPQRCIFLDMPKRDGKLVSLPKSKTLLIRYIHQGIMFGFRAMVNHEYIAPFQILIVDFPKQIEERNLRRSERIKTFIPISIRLPENAGPVGGAMMDLSREGALLSIDEGGLPVVGETVRISLKLPSGAVIDDLDCAVRNLREPKSLRMIGVEFEAMDEKKLGEIHGFYDYCLSPAG